LLNTTPGAADTVEIVILPDTAASSVVQTPGTRQTGRKLRRFGSTQSVLRVDSRGRVPVSDLRLQLNIDHPSIGELTVRLISPRGRVFKVHDRTGERSTDIAWSGQALDGETEVAVHGVWRLEIRDHQRPVEGRLLNWALVFPE
jgi:subtilisin-like proprotein convertase family protein